MIVDHQFELGGRLSRCGMIGYAGAESQRPLSRANTWGRPRVLMGIVQLHLELHQVVRVMDPENVVVPEDMMRILKTVDRKLGQR